MRKLFVALVATVAVWTLSGCGAALDEASKAAESAASSEPTTSEAASPSAKPKPTTAAPAKPKMTKSQEQAVKQAENYLETAPFSKKGLIEQLKFEGFSAKDAEFAVEHIKVNWNAQAAKAAQNYLDTSPFSRKGLIEQLEFEGYTTKQATYGVDKAGL